MCLYNVHILSCISIFNLENSPFLGKKGTKGPTVNVVHQITCQLLLLGILIMNNFMLLYMLGQKWFPRNLYQGSLYSVFHNHCHCSRNSHLLNVVSNHTCMVEYTALDEQQEFNSARVVCCAFSTGIRSDVLLLIKYCKLCKSLRNWVNFEWAWSALRQRALLFCLGKFKPNINLSEMDDQNLG